MLVIISYIMIYYAVLYIIAYFNLHLTFDTVLPNRNTVLPNANIWENIGKVSNPTTPVRILKYHQSYKLMHTIAELFAVYFRVFAYYQL